MRWSSIVQAQCVVFSLACLLSFQTTTAAFDDTDPPLLPANYRPRGDERGQMQPSGGLARLKLHNSPEPSVEARHSAQHSFEQRPDSRQIKHMQSRVEPADSYTPSSTNGHADGGLPAAPIAPKPHTDALADLRYARVHHAITPENQGGGARRYNAEGPAERTVVYAQPHFPESTPRRPVPLPAAPNYEGSGGGGGGSSFLPFFLILTFFCILLTCVGCGCFLWTITKKRNKKKEKDRDKPHKRHRDKTTGTENYGFVGYANPVGYVNQPLN